MQKRTYLRLFLANHCPYFLEIPTGVYDKNDHPYAYRLNKQRDCHYFGHCDSFELFAGEMLM